MIILENVCKCYEVGSETVYALDHANLRIERGEFVGIVGPSGSGKSTLMNIIGCLDLATSGSYELDGQIIEYYTEEELAQVRSKKIGFIFQNFNLIPKLSAEENVELPLIYQRLPRRERQKRVEQALNQVGLWQRRKHRPAELSGGQQQRVAIARALAARPALFLADEPTGNLDSKTTGEIMDIFHGLHEQGSTIIFITHDNSVAAQAARRVHILDGKVSEEVDT